MATTTRRPRKPVPPPAVEVPFNVTETYEGEYADWIGEEGDWQNTLTDAIQRGMFDTMLKPLARAIFDRRDVLTGKTPGESFKGADPEEDSAEQKPALTATLGQPVQAFVGKDAVPAAIHPVVPGYTGTTFTHNGLVYARRNVIGKVTVIPSSVDTDYLRGLKVKIKGCGPKMLSVEFIDLPPVGTTWRKKHDDKKPCFLPYSIIESHLKAK